MRAAAVIFALLVAGVARGAPSQVHLTWRGPTDTSMTVTWRADEPGGAVEAWADGDPGARRTQASESRPWEGGYLHTAQLTGLAAGTRYRYRCGSEGAFAPEGTFTTAPVAGARFTFSVWGDNRDNRAVRTQMVKAILSGAPAFSLGVGDYVESGGELPQWDPWFEDMEPLLRAVPLMPVIGNHEARADAYFAQLPTPAHPHAEGYHDQEYYSFDYASMHVVALSTEASAAGAQRDWLRADLAAAAARPGIRWTVAFGHRPPFSSGRHGSWLQAYEAWAPVFDEFRVPLTFWGHDHDYERTVPLRGGMAGGKGTVYVVTGGGGAPLGEVGASGFTAFSKTTYEFLEVEVGPDELSVTARDALGEAFDSFKVAHPSLAARREQQRPETIGREPTWPKAAALVGASALFAVVLLLTRRRTG